MNLTQLQAECGRLLNDPQNQRWGVDILTTRLNLSQTEVNLTANVSRAETDLSFVAGVNSIAFNTTVAYFNVQKVIVTRVNGSKVDLPGFDLKELDFRYPDWRQWSQGDPQLWFYNDTSQTIFFAPTPDANAASVTTPINITTVRSVVDMVAGTDVPFAAINSMVPFHMSLVHWTVSQCWMDDGTPESLGKAKFHKSGDPAHPGQYEMQLARIRETYDNSEGIQSHILWTPEGGRVGLWSATSPKSNPLQF